MARRGSTSPYGAAEPNDGHRAIVDLERSGRLHALLTQNVDGLHHAAGSDPALIVEVHGTVREVSCLDCGERAPIERALDRVRAGEEDPPCRTCGGILKSATISFGQGLVPDDLQRADEAARLVRPAPRPRHDARPSTRSRRWCRWPRPTARGS